jgi:hypothetical protein
MSPTAERIVAALSRWRMPLEDEKALQHKINYALLGASCWHAREYKLASGVIDFMVWDTDNPAGAGIGIEAKIKGGKRAIFRQLAGYCNDPRLAELIVATSLPLSLPPEIGGKPVAIVDLGRAWL